MVNLVVNLQSQFSHAYHWAEDMGVTLQHQISDQVQSSKDSIIDTFEAIDQNCRDTLHGVSGNCKETIDKIELFIYRHKETIFFLGCCAATAYFAPLLFFPTMIVTAALRVEFSRNCKNVCDEYLKDEKNPYKINPYFDHCIHSLDIAMETIAALDAIALGTIYLTNSWVVSLLPVIGGIAAGNCAAKWGMDISDFLVSDSFDEEDEG